MKRNFIFISFYLMASLGYSQIYETTDKVGIGANPTTDKLEVFGNIKLINESSFYLSPDRTLNGLNGHYIGTYDNTHKPIILRSAGVNRLQIGTDGYISILDNKNPKFYLAANKTLGGETGHFIGTFEDPTHLPIIFRTNGINRMKIGTSGNIAIYGKLEVEEIKVKLNPTADFVFEDTYKLRNLNDVKMFILRNKHLPDIPSAKEIETNGVNISQMNAKLLQKIEELTLYTIDQQEKIDHQNAKIEILQKQVEKLMAKIK